MKHNGQPWKIYKDEGESLWENNFEQWNETQQIVNQNYFGHLNKKLDIGMSPTKRFAIIIEKKGGKF